MKERCDLKYEYETTVYQRLRRFAEFPPQHSLPNTIYIFSRPLE